MSSQQTQFLDKESREIRTRDRDHGTAMGTRGRLMTILERNKKTIKTKDLKRALKWFSEHRVHVAAITFISDPSKSYPPSGSDCSQPELWKPDHWNWFLGRQEFPEEWVRAYGMKMATS